MGFNVRGSFHDLGKKDSWRNRAALNVSTIGRHAPTLVGLQECQRGNLAAYRKHLPRYGIVRGPRYGNVIPHDFNAILFDGRRLELLDSGGFWLSETPERFSRSWETRVARSANWALFRATGLSFLHLNTHLDHRSAPARREGAALILRKTDELLGRHGQDTPVLVTGDFNCRPGAPTYRSFIEAGFRDTFLVAGDAEAGDAGTFHAFRGARYKDPHPELGPRRIDWILLKDPARKLGMISHHILRDHDRRSGLYPSDHYPVLAEFGIAP